MANIESAKKRARQAIVRTARNTARRSRVRTMIRYAEEALSSGDKARANEAVRIAQKEMMKGVTKGILHLSTASRKVSRMTLRLKALEA